MNLLLDTHALIWWLEDSAKLGEHARAALRNPAANAFLSVVSVWEMSIKAAIGRLRLDANPEESIPELFAAGFQPLPIQFRHAFAVRHLPPHHSDPFDRMLIAQAQCEDLTIVTADSAFSAYSARTLDASL